MRSGRGRPPGGIALGALADRRYRAGHEGPGSGFAVGETRSAMAHPARTFRRMTFILQVSHNSLRKTSDFRKPARPALVGPIAAPTARGHPEAIACDRREGRSGAEQREALDGATAAWLRGGGGGVGFNEPSKKERGRRRPARSCSNPTCSASKGGPAAPFLRSPRSNPASRTEEAAEKNG
jgi:hypothetical protein